MENQKMVKPWSLAFYAIFLVLISVKTYFSVVKRLDWNNEPLFLGVVFATLGLMLAVLLLKRKALGEAFCLRKSWVLGTICTAMALIHVLSFWYGVHETIAKPDFWNNKLMMFIKAVFVVSTFIVMALTYFFGKNFFENCGFLVFGLTFYQMITILSTLTLENHNPEIYDVLARSCLLLFCVYHANSFLKISEKPMTKRLIFFGYSSILLTFMVELPKLIIGIGNGAGLSSLSINCVINLIFCIYVMIFLFPNGSICQSCDGGSAVVDN